MYKYENLITENSKNHNTESKCKKDNILSGKKNSFFPTTQSSQNQNRIQNNDGDSTLRNFQNSIKSTHYDNNDLIITNRTNAINSLNEITKTNDMPKKGKNKTFNDLYKKTYIFNYKPKNKKFNVLRNSKDIKKYLSKDNKHNRDNSNDNKHSNDNILDFDMGDSNVYYLVTHTYNHRNRNRNNNNNFIYNNSYNNNNNKLRNNKNRQNNNDNTRYNPKQKIGKISLPFCVYDNYPGYRRRYDDDDKNLLNFDMNDDLYNNSFDQNQLGSFTPNFLNPDDSNERFRKRDIIPEDLLDDDENENVENENDVDNELEKRNNMSVHIINNTISLPHETRKRYIDQNHNNPRLNLTDFRKRNKGFNDEIDNNDKDNGDKRKGVKSVPNKRNNNDERRSGNLIKLKKIEFLRDI